MLGSAAQAGLSQITSTGIPHPAAVDDRNHCAEILRGRNRLQDVLPHREELGARLNKAQRAKIGCGSNSVEALGNAFLHGWSPKKGTLRQAQGERVRTVREPPLLCPQ